MHLSDPIKDHFRLDEKHVKGLKRLKLETIEDILYYFPARYSDLSQIKTIKDLEPGDTATIYGTISGLKTKKAFRSKMPMAEGYLTDLTGRIKVMWFNQAYIAKMMHEGSTVKLTGKVADGKSGPYLSNPEFEKAPDMPIDSHSSLFGTSEETGGVFGYPVYPETRFVTSKWIYHAVQKILKNGAIDELQEYIPEDILEKYNLPEIKTALIWMHCPKKESHAEAARKRFAFEEVFFIQLRKQHDKKEFRENSAFGIAVDEDDIDDFVSRFSFMPTQAQMSAIGGIISDVKKPHPMARLLEGDVGSGKTAVAAAISYAIIKNRPGNQSFGSLQVAYMAPTEILATQLFENFIRYFAHTGINIALLTGSGGRKFPSKVASDKNTWTPISRAQLLKWVANGEVPILIGTHALIQKSVKFKHLALVIIDEQHRFGTNQRFLLARGKKHERDREIEKRGRAGYNFLDYKDLLYRIKNILERVYKELGSGKDKDEYIKRIAHYFDESRISYSRNMSIAARTKRALPSRVDFLIEEKLLLEVKQFPVIGPREKTEMKGYLKRADLYVGLVVGFTQKKADMQKVVLEKEVAEDEEPVETTAMPHLLSMTATPIPRTLALTIYGDLDLTILDQMPAGRKPIITEIITPDKRTETYDAIKKEMALGRQLYVICPRIDEPDPDEEMALQAKSVTAEAARLKKEVFKDARIDILHSKMKKEEKERIMKKFADHEIDILVATSVVEVGVNVPNATMIIIEGAERFGLAQLHQLRGRVIRGTHQAYCYLFADAKTQKTLDRLTALKTAKNGFELSELDLKLRGAGELGGGKQWGITDLGMEAIKNIKMVEAARTEAVRLIDEDRHLGKYPLLNKKIASLGDLHFE